MKTNPDELAKRVFAAGQKMVNAGKPHILAKFMVARWMVWMEDQAAKIMIHEMISAIMKGTMRSLS